MRALILSDIHGNLEALQAVLRATHTGEGAPGGIALFDQMWNLGDSVGYGGAPNEVLVLIRQLATLTVRGNHDRVCCGLTNPLGFNPVARSAALWTRDELTETHLQYLRELPQGPLHPAACETTVTCAHGSPLDEDTYILTMRDAWLPLRNSPTALTLFGHTHVQGGFAQQEHNWHELRPQWDRSPDGLSRAASWTLHLSPGCRYLINPGSVGQPRDHDWRAAYAMYDDQAQTLTFHRTPYDLCAAQGRILMAGLPERLALRLREGR